MAHEGYLTCLTRSLGSVAGFGFDPFSYPFSLKRHYVIWTFSCPTGLLDDQGSAALIYYDTLQYIYVNVGYICCVRI